MLRPQISTDLPQLMSIWLTSNLDTHTFVPQNYWKDNFDMVQGLIAKAEVYVYEDEHNYNKKIIGFIGLTDNFIAGLFVSKPYRSNGIGKQLLDYAKSIKSNLTLTVFEKNPSAIRFYKREGFTITDKHLDEQTKQTEYTMYYQR